MVAHDAWSEALMRDMQGQPQLALEAVQAAAFYDPDDRWLQVNLARRLRDFRRSAEALAVLRKASRMPGQESMEEWELAAGLWTENGQRDSAALAWKKVLEFDPHSREALLGMAALSEARGSWAEAANWYARLADEAGPRGAPLVERAVALWTRGDQLDSAVAWLAGRWNEFHVPSEGEALARIQLGAGHPDSASAILDTLADNVPEESRRYRLMAARALLSAGRRDLALSRLRDLELDDPSDSKVRASIGAILLDLDSLASARRIFTEEIRSDSSNAMLWYFLGVCSVRQDQLDSGRIFLDRSLALDSTAIDTWIRRGMLEMRGDAGASVSVFRRMVRVYPLLPQARFLLGFSLSRQALSLSRHPLREWSPPDSEPEATSVRKQALAQFDSALAIDSGLHRVRYERGSVLERLGRWKEAKRDLSLALAENPADPAVANYLGYALADRGESLPEADKLISAALSNDPENPAYLDSRAWLRYRQGRFHEALADVDKALSSGEDDLTLKIHRARILEALGRRAEAREIWTLVAKTDSGNPEAAQGLERTK